MGLTFSLCSLIVLWSHLSSYKVNVLSSMWNLFNKEKETFWRRWLLCAAVSISVQQCTLGSWWTSATMYYGMTSVPFTKCSLGYQLWPLWPGSFQSHPSGEWTQRWSSRETSEQRACASETWETLRRERERPADALGGLLVHSQSLEGQSDFRSWETFLSENRGQNRSHTWYYWKILGIISTENKKLS